MANSKRKCAYCKERFPVVDGIVVRVGFFCSEKHMFDYVKKHREKTVKKVNRQELNEFRLKDKSYRRTRAIEACNAYIRERDKYLPCISCDRPNDGRHQRHASHYRAAGSHPHLRFNELNIHASCSVCNNFKSGNLAEYRKRLIVKIGLSKVKGLESNNDIVKYTAADYLAIEQKYKRKLKELKASRI